MHKAGDWLTVLDGPDRGRTLQVAVVRMFATDCGYYFKGGAGLYPPETVCLARERTDGNPCGVPCDARQHSDLNTCDHCRGVCLCHLRTAGTEPG